MISLIVACSKNRVIGNKGQIPWKIKGEQKRFRELTTGNVVIMGRKSFEEIGKPLKNRTTKVVSNSKSFNEQNCFTVGSLKAAINLFPNREIYIAGGERIYREAIEFVDVMYITEIDKIYEGDTYFPEYDESEFFKEIECEVDGEIPYKYVTYMRKNKKGEE